MADTPTTPNEQAAASVAPAAPQRPTWKHVWQAPALLAGVVLLGAGAVVAFKTKPKPDYREDLEVARTLVEQTKYGQALEVLNGRIRERAGGDTLTPDQKREFYLLRARSLWLGQKELGIDRAANHRAVLDEYASAMSLHAELTPEDDARRAESHLALGEFDQAVKLAESLPAELAEVRTRIYRTTIERNAQSGGNPARALELLARLMAGPGTPREQRLWSVTRQTAILIDQGYAKEALDKAVREALRMSDGQGDAFAELKVEMARGYLELGDNTGAVRLLDEAALAADEDGPVMSSILTWRGIAAQRRGDDIDTARESFAKVLSDYSFSDDIPAAALGLAEVEGQSAAAGEGDFSESLNMYERVVDMIRAGVKHRLVTRERVRDSLLARGEERYRAGDSRAALRFAEQSRRLYGPDATPAPVLLACAVANRSIAEELLRKLAEGGVLSLAEADPATQREAREHLLRAGDDFRKHAAAIVADDALAYAQSLWAAAGMYDAAGDTRESAEAYRQFAIDFPGDERAPEARFRLARAYQARGDLELAASVYEDLRASGAEAGPYADAAAVPLAQTYMTDGKPENDSNAKEILEGVLAGRSGGPARAEYLTALRELGQYFVNNGEQQGNLERAIECFSEFLQRTESAGIGGTTAAREVLGVRCTLAEAYRRSADMIARTLGAAMPDSDRKALETARDDRLRRAGELYERARDGLEVLRDRTALEDLRLRNAYFSLGDCAFDRGDYEAAVRHYSAARERFPGEPGTLLAMVQLVACRLAQGDMRLAQTENERAMRFFKSLPDEVWDDPTLPMGREQWERWLESQARLRRLSDAGETSRGGQ